MFYYYVIIEGRFDNIGVEMVKEFVLVGIFVMLILDLGVVYMMEMVDMVLVGVDGVVESGGIINMFGIYQIVLVVYSLKKFVYVVVESYKVIIVFVYLFFFISCQFGY